MWDFKRPGGGTQLGGGRGSSSVGGRPSGLKNYIKKHPVKSTVIGGEVIAAPALLNKLLEVSAEEQENTPEEARKSLYDYLDYPQGDIDLREHEKAFIGIEEGGPIHNEIKEKVKEGIILRHYMKSLQEKTAPERLKQRQDQEEKSQQRTPMHQYQMQYREMS